MRQEILLELKDSFLCHGLLEVIRGVAPAVPERRRAVEDDAGLAVWEVARHVMTTSVDPPPARLVIITAYVGVALREATALTPCGCHASEPPLDRPPALTRADYLPLALWLMDNPEMRASLLLVSDLFRIDGACLPRVDAARMVGVEYDNFNQLVSRGRAHLEKIDPFLRSRVSDGLLPVTVVESLNGRSSSEDTVDRMHELANHLAWLQEEYRRWGVNP